MDRLPTTAVGDNTIYASILIQPNTSGSTVPINWDVVRRLRKCYQEAFKEKKITLEARELVIDVPWGKAGNRVLQVVDSGEYDITEVSHLKPTVFTEPTAFLAPIRVYLSPDVFSKAEHSLLSIRASAEEKFYSRKVLIDAGDDA